MQTEIHSGRRVSAPPIEELPVIMWHTTYATPSIRPSLLGVSSGSCDRQIKQERNTSDGWNR
ncbi:MAG TPA: hypothetical protein VFR11_08480 [Micromonosporaceae bacterium]|nr:hypothetical protein [Micromonosporaceae bacterium]